MPDFGSPVATGVNVNPNQGIQTLSGLLGLKAQQQGLVGQAAQVQSAQAEATLNQQKAKEIQAGAQLLSDPVGNGILDKNGNPTANAQTIVQQSMPTTGAEHYANLVKAAQAKVELTNSANNLRSNERTEIANAIGGAAADPKLQLPDVLDQLDALTESKKGTDAYEDYQTIAGTAKDVLSKAANHPALQSQGEPWRTAALGLQRTVLGAPGVVGAAGVATPQNVAVTTAAGIQPGTQAPALQGGGITPTGPLIAQPPQPITNAAGQILNRSPVTGAISPPGQTATNLNPSSPQVAGATSSAAGAANIDTERAKQVSGNIQQATAGIQTTQQIDDLAEQVHSGKFAAWVSQAAASAGLSASTYARQLLQKDLGIVKTQATGMAPSDQARETILSGFPESTSDPQTIHGAMDYVRGTFRLNQARGNLLNSYQQANPTNAGFQHADDALTSVVNPLMAEYRSLQTPQQRIGFYQRNFKTPQEAENFKNQVTGVGHLLSGPRSPTIPTVGAANGP